MEKILAKALGEDVSQLAAAEKQLLLASRRVQLVFGRPNGEALRVDAGSDYSVTYTRELEQRLARWLVASKSERSTPVREAVSS